MTPIRLKYSRGVLRKVMELTNASTLPTVYSRIHRGDPETIALANKIEEEKRLSRKEALSKVLKNYEEVTSINIVPESHENETLN